MIDQQPDLMREQAWSLYVRGTELHQIAEVLKRDPTEVAAWVGDRAPTAAALRDERHLESLRAQIRALHASLPGAASRRRAQIIAAVGRLERQIYEVERRRAPVAVEQATVEGAFTVDHFIRWAWELILDSGEHWRVEPFQADFIAELFAGLREAWLLLPQGNTKTTLMGGFALYHAQHKPWASVAVAASSRDQAGVMLMQAAGFVERSPTLHDIFEAQGGTRRIRCDTMNSRIDFLAADERTGDGIIPTLCLLDELHRHRDLRLLRTWRGKLAKRNAQMAVITTAGEPGSEFELTRDRIRASATSLKRAPGFLRAASANLVMHEWAVAPDADVEDLEIVKQANPFSGVTIEDLKAERDSPTTTLTHWRRFRCNLPSRESGQAVSDQEWADALTDDEIPEGEPIWLGFDGAWKLDTCAMVPFWPRDSEFRLLGPATIIRPPRDGQIHPDEVKAAIEAINDRNPIHTVVLDPSFVREIVAWLKDDLHIENVIEHDQRNQQSAVDFEYFMEAMANGWIKHTADEGLGRHVLNAVAVMLDSGRHKFERPKLGRVVSQSEAESRYVDALDAAAMVHSEYAAAIAIYDDDTIEVS